MVHKSDISILFSIGINHKSAHVDCREHIYLQHEEIPAFLTELKKTLDEAVVISTCNRTEIYGVTSRTDLDLNYYKDLLINFKNAEKHVRREDFFGIVSCSACQHLFHVTTSLDSLVVGDMQILGQVRDFYTIAENHGATGKILHQMFQRGLKIGKQVRTETHLQQGVVSISSAAVDLAANRFETLEGSTALIIGAGEMAKQTAELLAKKHIKKIIIANRTRANAKKLMDEIEREGNFESAVVDYADLKNYLNEADLLITATSSPELILNKADLTALEKEILMIDIAVPRDIDENVAENPLVTLKNVDDLNEIVTNNQQRRIAEVPRVYELIGKEMGEFLIWYYSLPLLPATIHHGEKPDAQTQREIIHVKQFLLSNMKHLHKMGLQNGSEDLFGHIEVVKNLVALKNAEFSKELAASA